jgi:hypothetical protein
MTPFFTRLAFAFKTFFAILFRDHIPDDVAASLLAARPAAPVASAATAAPRPSPAAAADPTATQLLALLQRDGRLIDFLMEDVGLTVTRRSAPPSAPCMPAAGRRWSNTSRSVRRWTRRGCPRHGGCERRCARIKLIGNVSGQPPFAGVLRHRGWVVTRIDLPALRPAAASLPPPPKSKSP